MFKNYLILLLAAFLLFACSNNPLISKKAEIVAEPTEEERAAQLQRAEELRIKKRAEREEKEKLFKLFYKDEISLCA